MRRWISFGLLIFQFILFNLFKVIFTSRIFLKQFDFFGEYIFPSAFLFFGVCIPSLNRAELNIVQNIPKIGFFRWKRFSNT